MGTQPLRRQLNSVPNVTSTKAFGAPLRRSRRDPEPGSGSIPTGSRSDPERTTDMFGIKSGSRELSPLEVEIKKKYFYAGAPPQKVRCLAVEMWDDSAGGFS
jgi:hypothetical protein